MGEGDRRGSVSTLALRPAIELVIQPNMIHSLYTFQKEMFIRALEKLTLKVVFLEH